MDLDPHTAQHVHTKECRKTSLYIRGSQRQEIAFALHSGGFKQVSTLDFAKFAKEMSCAIEDHILDKRLREWIMPAFSTTTDNDKVIASIVFMGAMIKYFTYGGMTSCGLPSVTLLGEKSD